MNRTNEEYKAYVESHAKKSRIVRNSLNAFWVGGVICCIGEIFYSLFTYYGMSEKSGRTLVSVCLVFLAVLLTGIGVFDKIAKVGGAGTLVPITGFANAVVAPALDTKPEGLVLGIGAKLFSISGAVILYGTLASVIYGIIYWIMSKI